MKFSAEFRKPAIELLISNLKEAKALSFRIVTPNSHVNVLGKKIELGSMTQYVKGMWDATYNEVKRWTENASDKDLLKVTINDAEIIEEFENWPRNQFNVN
jgi:hypothetical protein